jgi:hypothetical protein
MHAHEVAMILKRCAWIGGLLIALAVTDLLGATISWINNSGGSWSEPANWDAHVVPGSLDSVNITAAGIYTVTVDTNVSISSLTIGGASGQQTLTDGTHTLSITNTLVTANGILDFRGGSFNGGSLLDQGTFNCGGGIVAIPVTVAPGAVLNFNGGGVNIYAPLTNAGTINWSGSSLGMFNNAAAYTGAIYNQSAGLFILQCDQSLSSSAGGFELFSNAGTVRKTAGLGTSSISVAFANAGTLDAQSGTIRIAGPDTQTGGTMNFGITSLAYFGQIAFAANAPPLGFMAVWNNVWAKMAQFRGVRRTANV